MVISMIEVPLIMLGGMLFVFGGDPWRYVGVGLVALTTLFGSGAALLGRRNLKCPECGRPLERKPEGMYCVGCDTCYTSRPPSLGE